MAIMLVNLRGHLEDEIDEIRALLEEHRIDFYETPPNRWGISAGAIWLRDEDQAPAARSLLADYQVRRQARARRELAEQREAGTADTLWRRLLRSPLEFLLLLVAVAVIVYFTVVPFFGLGG